METLGHDIQNTIDKLTEIDKRHGGPHDRGGADSYYRRPGRPHYFLGGTHNSTKVKEEDMTEAEILAYNEGYRQNEEFGDHKDWG